MDNELFKSFMDKVDEILTSEETAPSPPPLPLPLPPPPPLLSSLSSSFDYKSELEPKLLPAIYIHSLFYLPT
jgi:hypothetical protein